MFSTREVRAMRVVGFSSGAEAREVGFRGSDVCDFSVSGLGFGCTNNFLSSSKGEEPSRRAVSFLFRIVSLAASLKVLFLCIFFSLRDTTYYKVHYRVNAEVIFVSRTALSREIDKTLEVERQTAEEFLFFRGLYFQFQRFVFSSCLFPLRLAALSFFPTS